MMKIYRIKFSYQPKQFASPQSHERYFTVANFDDAWREITKVYGNDMSLLLLEAQFIAECEKPSSARERPKRKHPTNAERSAKIKYS